MAKIEIIAPFILSFEGGYVNDPNDRGGATNKGVTLKTWRSVGCDKDGDGDIDVDDLKLITENDAVRRVMKPHYWDKIQADKITNQSVANIFADWVWCSGIVAIKRVQRVLGVTADGVVGKRTLTAINSHTNPMHLFECIKLSRYNQLEELIAKDPSQERFRRGWFRRVAAIEYDRLTYNNGLKVFVYGR